MTLNLKYCALLFGSAVCSAVASSQAQSVELSFGATNGRGGTYVNRSGVAAAVFVERTLVHRRYFEVFAGTTGFLENRGSGDLVCLLQADLSCAPNEPDLFAVSGALGARVRTRFLSLNGRIGPSLYSTVQHVENNSGVGLASSLSLGVSISRRIAVVASREEHVVSWANTKVRITGRLLGVRIAW